MQALARAIITINDFVRPLNMEIQKSHNEENGASNYVLVCTRCLTNRTCVALPKSLVFFSLKGVSMRKQHLEAWQCVHGC